MPAPSRILCSTFQSYNFCNSRNYLSLCDPDFWRFVSSHCAGFALAWTYQLRRLHHHGQTMRFGKRPSLQVESASVSLNNLISHASLDCKCDVLVTLVFIYLLFSLLLATFFPFSLLVFLFFISSLFCLIFSFLLSWSFYYLSLLSLM